MPGQASYHTQPAVNYKLAGNWVGPAEMMAYAAHRLDSGVLTPMPKWAIARRKAKGATDNGYQPNKPRDPRYR
jgi:hypothetical protein